MFAYRLLSNLIALPVLLWLVWRVLRRSESGAQARQRLGGGARVSNAIWVHAASNGELTSARPLIEALLADDPALRVLITTNTVSAQDLAHSWNDARIMARMAPLDHRAVVARFLNSHRPRALIIVENELWPNRMVLSAARGIPVIVIGARMSARSGARWTKTGLGRRVVAQVSALSAQDKQSEARFLALGLAPDRLLPCTNLKTATATREALPLDWPRATTVLAASTHEGEEAQVLAAFAQARAHRPDLRLILAPRHPRRAPEIAALIAKAGLAHTTRSMGDPPSAEVYLADTMGEMDNWYASAGICFVGGSLVEKGGHTPFEPAAHHCAILHGPHVENFRDAYATLDEQGGAVLCKTTADLADAMATISAADQTKLTQAATTALGPAADISALARAVRARL
ncbi:3-deoxy-D-manno-octulosonic acid transferase [Thioclava sp.]|uniref:3-deoxy-D-manno-octulosonic acid transferase n=1 Tax=Thioclava sp. TaxID=1933450 RepID=UPI003AA99A29